MPHSPKLRVTSRFDYAHRFIMAPNEANHAIPRNLFLVVGDEQLEIQMARVTGLTQSGPQNSWQLVHSWISDLIADIRTLWGASDATVFIDCNPSFTLYTEMAMSASDRLIIPFSADGSSKRAVRSVLSLVYGVQRTPGAERSLFYINSVERFRMSRALGVPIVRLTAGQYDLPGKRVMVNQTQLDRQIPNIRELVSKIE